MGSNPTLSAIKSESFPNDFALEKYSRGRRGAPAKGVGRVTGARVQIPLSPPEENVVTEVAAFSFFVCGKRGVAAQEKAFSPLSLLRRQLPQRGSQVPSLLAEAHTAFPPHPPRKLGTFPSRGRLWSAHGWRRRRKGFQPLRHGGAVTPEGELPQRGKRGQSGLPLTQGRLWQNHKACRHHARPQAGHFKSGHGVKRAPMSARNRDGKVGRTIRRAALLTFAAPGPP